MEEGGSLAFFGKMMSDLLFDLPEATQRFLSRLRLPDQFQKEKQEAAVVLGRGR